MSLTLNTSYNTGVDPVYNPIEYLISSNNSANLNYKYIFNLYSGSTAGNLLSTIRLNPRPNGSCQYNPARILEGICNQDLGIQNITGSTASTNEFKKYTIWFEEEFTGIRFRDTLFMAGGPYNGKTVLQTVGDNVFSTGDSITVTQDAIAYDITGGTVSYNGTYTIVAFSGGTYPIIDVPFITTTVNPGYLTYSSGSTTWVLTGTTYSAYTFNGVLEYIEKPSWNPIPYEVTTTGSAKKFLTNQPRSGIFVKNSTDRATLSFMHYSHSGTTSMNITRTYLDGTTSSQGIVFPLLSGTNITHIPSGPYNLNAMVGSNFIDVSSLASYSLFIDTGAGSTEEITYLIDQRCSKYQTVRLQFLNRLGGWDYVNFDMISRKTVNLSKRGTFKKNLPFSYQVGDREKTLIDIDGNYLYSINSNWMNNYQSAWIEELFTSQDVRIINSDGSSWPVNIQENSKEIEKTINQKMISYSFSLESAYSINTGRA